ncbi:hypothetical protein [Phaeobacter sp. JH57H1]
MAERDPSLIGAWSVPRRLFPVLAAVMSVSSRRFLARFETDIGR